MEVGGDGLGTGGFIGREEVDGGVEVDDFGGVGEGVFVGVGAESAVEIDVVGEDGTRDDEVVVAGTGAKGGGSEGGVDAGVEVAFGDKPGVDFGDDLVDDDVAFGVNDDLGDVFIGVATRSGTDGDVVGDVDAFGRVGVVDDVRVRPLVRVELLTTGLAVMSM